MKQLLRLLTALMLFFGLCHIVCAQRRGTMRFISSPDELSEWDSHKTVATSSDSISRADVLSHDNVQSTRRGRYRTTTTTTPPDDTLADFKTAKVPVYRVRGRNRSNKQDTENDKNLTESTTAATTIVKSNGESNNRTARRKQYQSNKQRTITRNENQSIETNNNSNKDAVSSTATHHATFSSRKHQTDLESTKSTTELPANHQPDNHRKTYSDTVNIRKQPTGRRYRIRTAEANAINANGQATESEKKVAAAAAINSATVSAVVSSTNDTKGKKTERNENGDDEQNYPEHFKALLKSKKTTVLPSSRINNVASKKQNILASTTSSTPEQSTTTLRPPYKHKKIERPNLKLLFPSLHTSSTTSESTPSTAPAAAAAAVTTINETDQMATTDELNTETNVPSDVPSTTVKSKTTVQKQISGVKFSSKIRTEGGDDSLAAFRSRSTSLVFDTKSSTSRTPNIKSDVPPTNHRFSAGPVLDTPKFSARYKSGEGALSLAAYRKNLMREKPPFYTPTTPPITTQVNEIDWAASDYSYHYNDVEPIRSGLMQNPPLNVETSHHSSSSVTVSIFGALSEILSHTTESLSFLTSTTTEYTPLSHTHSTFLSTNHDPAQIQKIQTDIPKIPSMTGDSTITTTTTTNAKINNDSNEFRLPILNAFDSNEAITSSSKPSSSHTTVVTSNNEQSAEQLGKYLQKANTSNIHSKSENVFSLAPPTSQLSDGSTNGFGLNGQYRPISLDDYDSLPSSNEVTSNESSSTTGNTESDPFSLSNEFDITQQQPTMTKATSPKSNREYITSFTTTTTTTQKPHIEKGVKIIRELVEQARTTEEPDTNRPIQSLTTVKTFVKEHRPVTTQKPKAPTSAPPVPANHRPTWAIESTSIRMKHPNHNFDGFDSTERYNNENAIKTSQRPTSTRTTTKINTTVKTTTRGNSITSATTRSPKTEKTKPTTTTTTTTSETELPIGINDIEDLLQSIPTTTRRAKPTTTTTTRTTTRATTTRSKQTTPAASDNDDLNFLRQVQRLLQRPTSTRKPIQTKSTTASTSVTSTTTNSDNGDNSTPKLEIYTVSKTKNENSSGGPTSTFDDLLNSFQKEAVTTTTRRPQLTTFSDADDIAFLKGLRQIAVDTSTPKTTRNPDFAKQIIAQFSLNQTSKVQPEKTNALNVDGYPQVPTIGRDEIEKNKNDVASLNTDLQLLSTLLGRPISQKDIPQLTKQASTLPPSISSTTLRTTTVRTTKPPVNPKIVQEIELLHQIAKKPDGIEPDNELTSTDELAAIDPSDAYGKTNDALLATLLKQRGIGPAHNNIPLNIYSTTTTMRPQYLSPARSPRPLIDGLSWLWKTWQDTAPGQGGYAPQSSRTRTRGTNSEIVTATDTDLSLDDGLDSDISSQPLDQSHTNGNSGFGFGSGLPGGGQLLSAALGVTRAVTQLLGSALQGAGKTIQSAWSTQAFGSASGGGGGDYFRLSG
ncbi:uncharacterized protein LOC116336839 isoform X2 [Contarinia nasturtii]|uniref:uncharacterized protein LOC116336839 isoform X2 n=1 Tax=Contarinia nasturtii TaxID=265458 RepID=UPI0012D40166|nr:uncharacterized protein LOC116336839 isoform X2 [Contarinia nasturtii]